jgi:hypothetical protein
MTISSNTKQEIIKRQLEFYYTLNKKCHIKLKPTGFRNGIIVSEYFEVGHYVMFEDLRTLGKAERLFIDMIHDIKDYEELAE